MKLSMKEDTDRQSDQTNPLSIYPNLLVPLYFVSTPNGNLSQTDILTLQNAVPNGNSLKPTQTYANSRKLM